MKMFKIIKISIAIVILAFAARPVVTQETEESALREVIANGEIEIIRDNWGIPNIFAETDEGAMFGLGLVTAEDRAFQMYYNLRIIQGRLSELIGNVPHPKKKGVTSLSSDRRMRMLGYYRAAKKVADNLDQDTKRLLNAYSNGVNSYMTENRKRLLHLFDKYGLEPEPWTPADCIAVWWNLGRFFASDGLIDLARYYKLNDDDSGRNRNSGRSTLEDLPVVTDDEAAVVRREDVTDGWVKELEKYAADHGLSGEAEKDEESPKFSHAWVVGGSKTTTKSSVLVSMPQTPVRNPSLLYEFHISGKTFNARGVGVAGSPVILIGFNENVAWGMTATGIDQADLFMLKTDQEHPNQYFFDGEWHDMDLRYQTIDVRGEEPVVLVVRETHFGPVVTELAAGARKGDEVAWKAIPVAEREKDTIQGAIAMLKSDDVYSFAEAIKGWRFPSANVVFGDSKGNTGYWNLGAYPVRSRYSNHDGSYAHDGTESKYDWQEILPYELLPHIINPKRGYIASANHMPVSSFYPLPVVKGSGDSIRSWRLKQLLSAKEKFTPEDLLNIHYDNVDPVKYELLRLGYYLRDNQKAGLSNPSLKALKHLESWYKNGARCDISLEGIELAGFLELRRDAANKYFRIKGGQAASCYILKQIKRKFLNSPDVVFNRDEQGLVDHCLSYAWKMARKRYGKNTAGWHDEYLQEISGVEMDYFMTLGGFGSLDSDNDVTRPELGSITSSTIQSQAGQTYIQYVPLHNPDQARSLLPIGISEHPGSEHRLNTLKMWEKGILHPAPLSREKVSEISPPISTTINSLQNTE